MLSREARGERTIVAAVSRHGVVVGAVAVPVLVRHDVVVGVVPPPGVGVVAAVAPVARVPVIIVFNYFRRRFKSQPAFS